MLSSKGEKEKQPQSKPSGIMNLLGNQVRETIQIVNKVQNKPKNNFYKYQV